MTFFVACKGESVVMTERGWFADEAGSRSETFRWIAFHNHRRRHRRAGMFAPVDYEQRDERNHTYTDSTATTVSMAA